MVSATDIAEAVRQGRTGAVEVVSEALGRSESSTLNVFTLIDRDGAIDQAREIDDAVARGVDPGPLAGVPVGLKDLIDQEGLPTTCGSGFYRQVPTRSAAVVDRLHAAGAVIIGRTGLHEFAYGFSSENHWFGPVLNPWDPETSPGGSSGGSAAAVASGLAPLAIGTDTGGSIRVPAAMCAVIGLKVTHGRVPLTGVFPLAPSLDTVGPLGRTVDDVALMYSVMAGYDEADPWSSPRALPAPVGSAADLSGLRIGIPRRWIDDAPMSPHVAAAFREALDRVSDDGGVVVELADSELVPARVGNDSVSAQAARVHRPWFGAKPYGPEVQERLAAAFEVTLDQYLEALEWTARVRNRAEAAFRDVDVLMTPTVAATRKVIGDPTIDEVPYRAVLSWFTSLVNHMGVPALSIPLAVAGAPPPSLQIIAPWWAEHRLLSIGRALERLGVAAVPSPPGVWTPQ